MLERRGVAHRRARERKGEREFEWERIKACWGCDRRLDLGLQDAPRSTIYGNQAKRLKGK